MTSTSLLTFPTARPDDVTVLNRLTDEDVANVVAVIGKTEGNGCVNDFSRTLAASAWDGLLPESAITVFSGGTEGVLSPHVNLFIHDEVSHDGHDRGLVTAAGRTRKLAPEEIGREPHLSAVSETVSTLIAGLGVNVDDVHLVLVKCPLLTSDAIAGLRLRGIEPVTTDTYESMSYSRAASSLGIAVALGEATHAEAAAALTGGSDVWSARASASSGAELDDCHVFIVAESDRVSNPLRAVHTAMKDALDIEALTDVLDRIKAERGIVRQIFAKAEADPTGAIRGRRHTMLTDSDLNSTRHARAAVGGLIAALHGDGAIYVSGGAEHQGPPGGGSVTVIYETPAIHLASLGESQ
jgi:cyanuric acid amidohydrolase